MTSALVVPIRIDALLLERETLVLSPTADFSRLPYRTATGDVNPDVAWLSEEIVPQPFEGAELALKAGLHLHWALPDSFLRGTNQGVISVGAVGVEAGLELPEKMPKAMIQALRFEGLELSEETRLEHKWSGWRIADGDQKLTISLRGGIRQPWREFDIRGIGGLLFKSIRCDRSALDLLNAGMLSEELLREFQSFNISEKASVEKEGEWLANDPESGAHTIRLRQDKNGRITLQTHARGVVFPAAPNRWLVQRTCGQIDHRWVIESDRFCENWAGRKGAQEPVRFPTRATDGGSPPKQLGQVLSFEDWTEKKGDRPEDYLTRLTAAGYGDPGFAASYPNCHSVFGFHDPEIKPESSVVHYHVLGWHSDPADDPLQTHRFNAALENAAKRYGLATSPTSDIFDALREEALEAVHGWSAGLPKFRELPSGENRAGHAASRFPERAVLFGSATINCKALAEKAKSADKPDWREPGRIEVALGHSVTEAISAFAAGKLSADAKQRAQIEDQIEALHLASKIQGLRVDVGPKFQETRHEQEFGAVDAGKHWVVVPGDSASGAPAPMAIDPELENALKALNRAEVAVARLSGELASLRRQLYSDWCKYMLCAYPPEGDWESTPDMDEARAFIERKRGPLDPESNDGPLETEKRTREKKRAAKRERDAARERVEVRLPKDGALRLKALPGVRFWRPREPVLLISGECVSHAPRHGRTELLTCTIADMGDFSNWPRPLREEDGPLKSLIRARTIVFEGIKADGGLQKDKAKMKRALASAGHVDCDDHPWSPIFLDWKVRMTPGLKGGNISATTRAYETDFITSHFDFDPECSDLVPRPGALSFDEEASTAYQGRSFLTPHVGDKLRKAIEDWFSKQLSLPDAKKAKQDVQTGVAKVYSFLFGTEPAKGQPIMAQALTGFNAALLMQRQTLQLPVKDPLGFARDRDFAAAVAEAVAGENVTAPQPQNEFHPIRSGGLKIEDLSLVDTFGQARKLKFEPDQLITAESMTLPKYPGMALLRPRIVQPARLKFRFLAASDPAVEWGDPPQEATESKSALCGWLVHDLSADGLLVHASDGTAIGRISSDRHWHGAPGVERIAPWQITNPHLARLVVTLIQDEDLKHNFLEQLKPHLDAIIPEEFAEHDGVQLLLGRPLAVVRARLELQLFGHAAWTQNWQVFWSGLAGGTGRSTDGFDSVKFKVRLGDKNQLNDGLVASWLEMLHADGRRTLEKHAKTSAAREDMESKNLDGDVKLAITDAGAVLTMLIDPRAPVHARTGILPAKAIALPKSHYAEILSRMSVALPVGPFLCPLDRVALYAPDTTRFAVNWVERERGESLEEPIVGPPATSAEWAAPIGIREGWIKLSPKTER